MNASRIIAVVGMPRSGTSLMMRMLDVGGVETIADNKASYEDSRCNILPAAPEWLYEAGGKAVKILEPHQFRPPRKLAYDFIWMNRNRIEQGKSNAKFLKHVAGLPVGPDYARVCADSIERDVPKVKSLLEGYPDARMMEVQFEELLEYPARVARAVAEFLGRPLNLLEMAAQVVPRSPANYDGFLELSFVDRT